MGEKRVPVGHEVCRDCDKVFDLEAQNYFDNICPNCIEDEEKTWGKCAECRKKIPPEEETLTQKRWRTGMGVKTEMVITHEGECAEKASFVPPP